jgi:hypothetical protein
LKATQNPDHFDGFRMVKKKGATKKYCQPFEIQTILFDFLIVVRKCRPTT